MKIVIQRVSSASVEVSNTEISSIGKGLLLLVGAEQDDINSHADFLAEKILGMRIFEDADGKMNLSVCDVGGDILAVSQFTLAADVSKGRRPSFGSAMEPDKAEELFNYFVTKLGVSKLKIKTGQFGAKMDVKLTNDGPVTFVLKS